MVFGFALEVSLEKQKASELGADQQLELRVFVQCHGPS